MIRAELMPAQWVIRRALFRKAAKRKALKSRAVVRRHGWKLLALVGLYLFASAMEYRDQAVLEAMRRAEAEQRVAELAAFRHLDPVTFVVQARDFDEARATFRGIEHAAVAKQAEVKAAGGGK